MSCLLCCWRPFGSPTPGSRQSVRDPRRYTSLTVSYNTDIAVTRSTRIGIPYEAPFVLPAGNFPVITDFRLQKTIGQGSFGKVLLAEHLSTRRLFALKVVPKSKINTDKQIEQIKQEILILKNVRHPNCVTLHCSFQDEYFLFYIFTYIPGGSLHFHLHHREKFTEPMARFYIAEVTLAFEYLHSQNIIYRDLKPENCMLTKEGHLVLVDFGSAKKLDGKARTSTFIGTPHYMAPEVLRGQPYNYSADWWSLGILLFEMLTGDAPFKSTDRIQLYRSVLRGEVDYPEYISPRARDLLSRLIERNTDVRLGSFTETEDDRLCVAGIKDHLFFSSKPVTDDERIKYRCLLAGNSRQSSMRYKVTGAMKRFTRRGPAVQLLCDGEPNTWTWNEMENHTVKPPLRPKLENPLDTQFFDTSITCIPPTIGVEERGERSLMINDFNYLISALPSDSEES